LFNGSIPLIALKMSAYKYDDKVFLKFVKVVDERSYGFVDEDEPIAEQVDREYWEKKRPKKILEITDEFINLIKQADVNSVPKYNKYYIGFTANGTPSTSINAKPRVNSVIVQIKLLKDEEIDNIIEVSGMDLLTYETKYSQYRIRLNSKITEKQKEVLLNLIKQSRQLTEK